MKIFNIIKFFAILYFVLKIIDYVNSKRYLKTKYNNETVYINKRQLNRTLRYLKKNRK